MVAATAPATPKKPRVGIYKKISAELYHRLDAANFSSLKLMQRSPAHAYEAITRPKDPTAALTFGDAMHAILLEPNRLTAEYFAAPTQYKKSKAEQAAWRDAEAENPGKSALRPNEWKVLSEMRESVMAHPVARAMIEHSAAIGAVELSAVWTDPASSVLCKLRVDGLSRHLGRGCIYDVKTCEDARVGYWERVHIPKYAYHAQGAHYQNGLQVLAPTDEIRPFYWIAVEKKPPFGVMVLELDPFDADFGRSQLEGWLREWARCEESGVWPGYPTAIGHPKLPDWTARDFEAEEEERDDGRE